MAEADPAAFGDIEIAPSELALHWPSLDADIYMPSLMQSAIGTKLWMAAQLDAAGSIVTAAVKAAAARQNGANGGGPASRHSNCCASDGGGEKNQPELWGQGHPRNGLFGGFCNPLKPLLRHPELPWVSARFPSTKAN